MRAQEAQIYRYFHLTLACDCELLLEVSTIVSEDMQGVDDVLS